MWVINQAIGNVIWQQMTGYVSVNARRLSAANLKVYQLQKEVTLSKNINCVSTVCQIHIWLGLVNQTHYCIVDTIVLSDILIVLLYNEQEISIHNLTKPKGSNIIYPQVVLIVIPSSTNKIQLHTNAILDIGSEIMLIRQDKAVKIARNEQNFEYYQRSSH